MRSILRYLSVTIVLFAVGPTAAAGPWFEVGDAGQTLATAQVPVGVSPLTAIHGTILPGGPFPFGSVDADIFRIFIANPGAFSATATGMSSAFPGSELDTQLFLFDASGRGVYHNDDTGDDFFADLGSTLPAGHPLGPQTPGFYFLAITASDNDPFSTAGNIFANFPLTAIHGPSGPGGALPLTGFTGQGFDFGSYTINLTGALFVNDVPEPASALLFGLGAAGLAGCGWFRRRRGLRA